MQFPVLCVQTTVDNIRGAGHKSAENSLMGPLLISNFPVVAGLCALDF